MTTFSVKLPDPLMSQVETKSRQLGVSRSRLIRQALEKMLQQGKRDTAPFCYDLMSEFCGIIKTGSTDRSYNKRHMKGYGQ